MTDTRPGLLFDTTPDPRPTLAEELAQTAALFPPVPTARRTDPPTAHGAAARAGVRAGSNRALALACLVHAGPDGLTDFELADLSGKAQTSIGVRRKELCRMGLVEGTTRTRPAPSGSPAAVWVATRAGIAYDEAR